MKHKLFSHHMLPGDVDVALMTFTVTLAVVDACVGAP